MENEQQTTIVADEQNIQNDEQNNNPDEQNTGSDEQNTASDEQNTASDEQNTASDEQNDLYGAPESYDFKSLELPEGVEYNEEYGNKFSEVAKELNLSQSSANKIINVYLDVLKSQAENVPEALNEIKRQQVEADVAEWDKMINQDAEIGNGNKDKIEAYMAKANEGYKAFASDNLQDVLKQKGLNHHPEIIKLFYKLSDLTGEDKILTGGNSVKEESPAEILYGKK